MNRRIIRSGVYQIVNEVNGKFYVGSSVDIRNRWSNWKRYFKNPRQGCCILWDAVQKYGVENFTFIIVEDCEPIKQVLLSREQFYIDTLKPVYNILSTAGSRLGSKGLSPRSEAAIAKTKATRQSRGTEWARAVALKARATIGVEGRKAIAAKVLATLGMDGIKSRNEKIKAALGMPEIRAIRSALSQQMWDNRDCDDRAAIGAKIAKTQADRGDEWRKNRAAKQHAARYATGEIPLGIYCSSSHQKWVTTATKLQAGKRLHIGSFDTLEEAIEEQKRYYDSGLRPFERHPKGIHRSENAKSWCVRSLVSKIGRSKYIGMADTIEAAIAMQDEFHTRYKAPA